MALTDAVAGQIMGELHVLTKDIENQTRRIELVAATVVAAANQVNARKTILHSQNEKLFMDRVNEITRSIADLKGLEGAMQIAARAQASATLEPLVERFTDVSNAHLKRQVELMKQVNAIRNLYTRIARNITLGLIIFLVVVGAAFFAGTKVGGSSLQITNDSEVSNRSPQIKEN